MTAKVLPQWYAGVNFRSSLEARWAVFFDTARVRWEYEPEGFVVGGRPYRPDFLLRDCGTWVEVKGDPGRLDMDLMCRAAAELPKVQATHERGPRLMILGPIPEQPPGQQDGELGDWGWVGLDAALPPGMSPGEEEFLADRYGFGCYAKNLRPWWLDWESYLPAAAAALQPKFDPFHPGIPGAYAAARAYRFGRPS